MAWPSALVWSSAAEVQSILSVIPGISIGVLGMASAMLLLATSKFSRDGAVLTMSAGLAFASGFFDLIRLVSQEGVTVVAESNGHRFEAVLSEILASLSIAGQLLYANMRVSRSGQCRSLERLAEVNSHWLWNSWALGLQGRPIFRAYIWLSYAAAVALGAAWRDMFTVQATVFKRLFLADNALQFITLLTMLAIVGLKIAYIHNCSTLLFEGPLIFGLLLATSIRVTGFVIHAFPMTPFAALLNAIVSYIFLVDLLCFTYRGTPSYPRSAPLVFDKSDTFFGRTSEPPGLPPKSAYIGVTGQNRGPLDGTLQLPATSPVSTLSVRLPHRESLTVGPVIRHGSNVPSWLLPEEESVPKDVSYLDMDTSPPDERGQGDVEKALIHPPVTKEKQNLITKPMQTTPDLNNLKHVQAPELTRKISRKAVPRLVSIVLPSPEEDLPCHPSGFCMTTPVGVETKATDALRNLRGLSIQSSNPIDTARGSSVLSALSLSFFPKPPIRASGQCKQGEDAEEACSLALQLPRPPALYHPTDSWQSQSTPNGSDVVHQVGRGFDVTSFLNAASGDDYYTHSQGNVHIEPSDNASLRYTKITRATSVNRASAKLVRAPSLKHISQSGPVANTAFRHDPLDTNTSDSVHQSCANSMATLSFMSDQPFRYDEIDKVSNNLRKPDIVSQIIDRYV